MTTFLMLLTLSIATKAKDEDDFTNETTNTTQAPQDTNVTSDLTNSTNSNATQAPQDTNMTSDFTNSTSVQSLESTGASMTTVVTNASKPTTPFEMCFAQCEQEYEASKLIAFKKIPKIRFGSCLVSR